MSENESYRFEEAREALRGKALVTPLIPLTVPSPIYLKAENLQPGGSFKIRGASYCISRLPKTITHAVAYSTGNHAQAVAIAARLRNMKSTIVMSPEAKEAKVEATKRFGAHVVMVSASERKKHAEALAREPHSYLVPPYDHPDIITGQGTIGLEILDEIDPGVVFVPVGGGGLISGIAMAIKQKRPDVKVIGVEPELDDDVCRSFKTGVYTTMPAPSKTIADAVRIQLGQITFPLIRKYVDDIITVSEDQIVHATLKILESTRLLAEPAGGLALAGALHYRGLPPGKPIVCVVSGGNMALDDLCLLREMIKK